MKRGIKGFFASKRSEPASDTTAPAADSPNFADSSDLDYQAAIDRDELGDCKQFDIQGRC